MIKTTAAILERYADKIQGVLSCYDRIVHIRRVAAVGAVRADGERPIGEMPPVGPHLVVQAEQLRRHIEAAKQAAQEVRGPHILEDDLGNCSGRAPRRRSA